MISVSNFIRIIVLSVLFFFFIEFYFLSKILSTILIFGLVCLFLFRTNFLLKLLNIDNQKENVQTISLETANKTMFQVLLGFQLVCLVFGFGGLFDLVIQKTSLFSDYNYFKLILVVIFALILLFFKPKLKESNPKKQFLELLLNTTVVYLLFFKIVSLLDIFFALARTTDYNYFKNRTPFMDYGHILVYATIYLVLAITIFFCKNKIIELFFNKIKIDDNENSDTTFLRYSFVIFSLLGIMVYLVDFFNSTIDYIGCLAPNRYCDIMFSSPYNYGSFPSVEYYLFSIFLLFFVFIFKNKKINQLIKP